MSRTALVLTACILGAATGRQLVLDQGLLSQPEAGTPQDGPHRPLTWGDLNVISTTDTHGWLRGHLGHGAPEENASGDFGDLLSFTTRMKARAESAGMDLLLVDSGDTVDGNGLTDASPGIRGAAARELFFELPYDCMTLGNHELYNYTVAHDIYTHFVPRWNGTYLASNVDIVIEGERRPFASRFRRWRTKQGRRVFSLGIMFDFKLPAKGLFVQRPRDLAKEGWLHRELEQEEVDVFVVVGHMPVYDPNWKAVLRVLRRYHPATPVLLYGGHAHVRDCRLLDERTLLMASGRYMETIGWSSLNLSASTFDVSRRYLDQNRRTYKHHLGIEADDDFDTIAGTALSKRLTAMAASFNLSRVFGYAPRSFFLNRYPYTHPASLSRFLTHEVFPKMIRNDSRPQPPLMIVNTGSTRFDISEGPFTVDSQLLVLPFINRNVCIRDVPREVAEILVTNLHGEPGDETARSSGFMHREAAIKAYGVETGAEEAIKYSYGYVTLDECDQAGGRGDDTLHRPLPAFPLPEYVGTELPEGPVVDVAFFDFVADVILRTLNRLQSDRVYTMADVELYTDLTSNVLLGAYAERYWPGP